MEIYLKRYLLEHRVSRRKQWVIADSFHSACQQLGWLPADTCLLKIEPVDETPPAPAPTR
jgi:hypothetical protein